MIFIIIITIIICFVVTNNLVTVFIFIMIPVAITQVV